MAEAVRLVVWDLDDTFWKGTVSEGGIREYVREHHNIVIELARRGIISSICSKNDPTLVMPILEESGIHDYFVFPSISWEPKGPRLAQLIETVQLRPETVMFIDDNPSNRAEGLAAVPGLQVNDESFIPVMLDHPGFAGKDDSSLTRLQQYKLMQTRLKDREQASGSNEEFLRTCAILLRIEYDVEAHIDRAIELINRTNQLNFTKQRLPEDKALARQWLLREVNSFDSQSGLIEVADKYGQYGMVGFFLMRSMRSSMVPGASNSHLLHFCFSCRTLGMRIEQWVYEYLKRPELHVVGEVLTNLSESRLIDWVRQVESFEIGKVTLPPIAPQITICGGCESNAVGVYLNAYTPRLDVIGNYAAGGCFVRVASAALIMNMCSMTPAAIASEAEILGLPIGFLANDILRGAVPGTLYVFNFGHDAGENFYYFRHRLNGLALLIEPRALPAANFLELEDEDLVKHLQEMHSSYTHEQREHIRSVGRHLRENYELVLAPSLTHRLELIRKIIEMTPMDSKIVIVVDHDEIRNSPDAISPVPELTRWAELMRELASEYPFVGVVTFSEVIKSQGEIQLFGNHYHREVYLRLAQRVVSVAQTLEPKTLPLTAVRSSWTVVCSSREPLGLETLTSGWSSPEPEFTWSDGNLAVLTFAHVDRRYDYSLQLVISGVSGPIGTQVQRVSVKAGEFDIGTVVCRGKADLEFFIPRAAISSEHLTVLIALPDAISPHPFLHNEDRRLLGLAVNSIALKPFRRSNRLLPAVAAAAY